jgi:ubiquitin-small subunit ribosomal protein S27Ae
MAKKSEKKGKKPHKNKPTSKKYSKYKVEGDKISLQGKFCPRCGPGIFLMVNQGRKYCGKCHYSEFEGKKPEAEKKAEDKNPEKKQ